MCQTPIYLFFHYIPHQLKFQETGIKEFRIVFSVTKQDNKLTIQNHIFLIHRKLGQYFMALCPDE